MVSALAILPSTVMAGQPMKRLIQGEHREECTLLPESLDDYVADTNQVRVVDAFVGETDLGRLGFGGVVVPAETGRPAYHLDFFLQSLKEGLYVPIVALVVGPGTNSL